MKPEKNLPIVLSGLVCPGLGQIAQKRWIAGLFFLAAALALFCYGCAIILVPVIHNLKVALGFTGGELLPLPFKDFFLCLLSLIALYALSLADVWRVWRKM